MSPNKKNQHRVILKSEDEIFIFEGDNAEKLEIVIMQMVDDHTVEGRHINQEKAMLRKIFNELLTINKMVYKNYEEPKNARRLIQ